jgi:uncharacterized protein
MIHGAFVIDATVHGFNFSLDNCRTPMIREMRSHGYDFGVSVSPHPKWDMTREEFYDQFNHQPDVLLQMMFAESQTDAFIYHGVPLEGLYFDGSSPAWVGLQAAARYPHRAFVYLPVYPWQEDALEKIDEHADNPNVIGVKLYPADLAPEGGFQISELNTDASMRMIEHCRSRGIKMIAVHKAVPIGPFREVSQYFNVTDMRDALDAFPDMTFEVVHGGFAFLDETVELLERYPNVLINLEGNQAMMRMDPPKWNNMMSKFLQVPNGAERILWSVASSAFHAQPWIEMFWQWQLPAGGIQVTDEMKANILGANYARALGWDIEAMKTACAADDFGLHTDASKLRAPWAYLRDARAAAVPSGV